MAKKLAPGKVVGAYRVEREIASGMAAVSYEAVSVGGQRIFLKQYKSPASTVPWYRPFITYQEMLQSRLTSSHVKQLCVRVHEAFEAEYGGSCFFQAFEYVSSGSDLEVFLQSHERSAIQWQQRLTWGKRLVGAIAALHAVGIAHLDLKPANVHLIADSTIRAGYQLKLIDMDFSVVDGHQPPWAGYIGHMGTANYKSPEHMGAAQNGGRSAPPGIMADIFTCGILLYQLLCDVHPFWRATEDEYKRAVLAKQAPDPCFLGEFVDPDSQRQVGQAMKACLRLDPSGRPTAPGLLAVLNGSRPISAPTAAESAPRPKTLTGDAAHRLATQAQGRIKLVSLAHKVLPLGITTALGVHLCRLLGDEARWWSRLQCTLSRDDEGKWSIEPNANAINPTLLNGQILESRLPLSIGDVIAVGRPDKGLVKLPLTVQSGG
jgi:eukaryotic-like serine/threonine-protein kinase